MRQRGQIFIASLDEAQQDVNVLLAHVVVQWERRFLPSCSRFNMQPTCWNLCAPNSGDMAHFELDDNIFANEPDMCWAAARDERTFRNATFEFTISPHEIVRHDVDDCKTPRDHVEFGQIG